jgi:hypothetical protein
VNKSRLLKLATLSAGLLPAARVREFHLEVVSASHQWDWKYHRDDTAVRRFLHGHAHMCPQRSGMFGLTAWKFFARCYAQPQLFFELERFYGEINATALAHAARTNHSWSWQHERDQRRAA